MEQTQAPVTKICEVRVYVGKTFTINSDDKKIIRVSVDEIEVAKETPKMYFLNKHHTKTLTKEVLNPEITRLQNRIANGDIKPDNLSYSLYCTPDKVEEYTAEIKRQMIAGLHEFREKILRDIEEALTLLQG